MDLRLIEMFQAVMRYRSVTEAARSLGVSQPAVSAALGRLEKEVGFALFRREGRNITPTPEALLLDEEAVRRWRASRNWRTLRQASPQGGAARSPSPPTRRPAFRGCRP